MNIWERLMAVLKETAHNLKERQTKVTKRFEAWKANPKALKMKFWLCVSITAIFWILFGSVTTFQSFVLAIAASGDGDGSGIFFAPFAPPFFYWLYIKHTQIDVIKMLIAEKFQWQYDPDHQPEIWRLAAQELPEVFNKGNTGQYIEDQFWGNYKDQEFWSGVFHYETRRGRNSNSRTDEHFFALKLRKPLNNRFLLKPETMGTRFSNFFSKKDIDTESVEFNKMFQVSYTGEKAERQLDIVKNLSPSILTRLTDLVKRYDKTTVLFTNDIAIFSFKKRLVKSMKTNFILKDVKLDPRDQEFIEEKMNLILEITRELLIYLR
jgi:hypothetical protein